MELCRPLHQSPDRVPGRCRAVMRSYHTWLYLHTEGSSSGEVISGRFAWMNASARRRYQAFCRIR